MTGPAIVVRDLRKTYGETEALRGVTFEIAEGEVFGLLGPNGAGKTTTVEILEGYRPRDGGVRHRNRQAVAPAAISIIEPSAEQRHGFPCHRLSAIGRPKPS